jgi:hypothetical protein
MGKINDDYGLNTNKSDKSGQFMRNDMTMTFHDMK